MFAFITIAALVTCSLASPWYAAGYCADTHDQCTTTSWIADCAWNPTVQHQCPQTCGLCLAGYQNGYYGSYAGSYYGSYSAYAPYLAAYTPVYECSDAIEGCADLAAAGWCGYEYQNQHAGLVSTQCKRTCGFCGLYYKK